MQCTRRTVLAAAALTPTLAQAQTLPTPPDWLREHPAFAPWEHPTRPADRLLSTYMEPDPGAARVTVRAWLGGRPSVVAVWATWCPPCMAEKRPEAQLSAQLEASDSRTQIRGLLAYDRAHLADARARLEQIGAGALHTGRATDAAEQSLLWIFGFNRDHRSTDRTSDVYAHLSTALPFTLLLDANGGLLGRITGTARDDHGRSYWQNPATFDLLQRLGES